MMWTVTNIWLSHLFTCLTQNWSTWDIFHRISFKWWRLWIWHLLPFQQIFQKRLNLLKNCLFEKCSDGQSVFKSLLTHELINYTSFLNNKSYLIWQNLTLHFCQLSKKSLIYFWKRDFHLESHFDFFLLGVHRVLEVCDRKAAVRRPRTRFDLSAPAPARS